MSFNGEADLHDTQTLVELGNRFLRLPELGPSSVNKRDPQSDVTFCCGILIYLLTAVSVHLRSEVNWTLAYGAPDD
jgi:hypothetical protein